MKLKYLLAFLSLFPIASCMASAPFTSLEEPQNLIVHNRILAKVNDKTISVVDVMKKMDVYLNRAYPHLTGSKLARYQFYSANWRETLDQMIDDELMLIDSEGKDLKITDGDVRENLQERFGPNVMANLDKLGLSYDEARKMIHTELVVQKMVWFRVNAKALLSVNPKDIKEFYKDYCLKNPPVERWKYQVLSIRARDTQSAEILASKAYERLMMDKTDLQTVASQLQEPRSNDRVSVMHVSHEQNEDVSISVSEEYEVTDKEISDAHKKALIFLKPGSYSKPISQLSRFDNSTVYRIFYLKDHSKSKVPQFEKIEEKLENELIQQAIGRESGIYIQKLRERLGYDAKNMQESIPNDFQPFTLN